MNLSRCILCAGLALGLLSLSQSTARPFEDKPAEKASDEKVKELIAKYGALADKAQLGPEGARIIEQLKALRAGLSDRSKEKVARLETSRNLRQLGLAIHNYATKDEKKPPETPNFADILKYMETDNVFKPAERSAQWEYKILTEEDVRKLGKTDLTAGLNKLGEESWEMVSSDKGRFFFKRRK